MPEMEALGFMPPTLMNLLMESSEDCCVKVAVHVRPLIGVERLQGCKDCVSVVTGKPQVQIGTHSFTFDNVYGSGGSPSSAMFEECVAPLVDGLFQGYNATVLAYGQTGSGKTYTMGTGGRDGYQFGLIHQAMSALFSKIENLKHCTEFQLHVSFIEILKEEVRDLLDTTSMGKTEASNGHAGKLVVPEKPSVQIRETSNGVITLSGSTEVDVRTQKEMVACLEQGSLSRATGSTNMNNQSSRSHAIFTITLEQMRQPNPVLPAGSPAEDMTEDYLCAKFHLVDLAGSERAKRTGSEGLRFKEACISPADINVEETLNTLKYANRARNIQNKPIVNRDPTSNEMQKLRQQLEYLQSELHCARGCVPLSDEVQALKERIFLLEATNEELCRELHGYHSRSTLMEKFERNFQEKGTDLIKGEGLERGLQNIDVFDYHMSDSSSGVDNTKEMDEEAAKEWEHTILQNTMDREMNELNKRLEQKERERDHLLAEVESLAATTDGQKQKLQDIHVQKLKALEAQILDFKKKQETQVQLLKQKQRSDEATKRLQDEIQFMKAQKVQLQQKIKQGAEQFRQWKASREKELLQLRKEGRRNEYERHKLQALNQRQKQVLQRKTAEAAMATKRLKELLEARKSVALTANGSTICSQGNEKSLQCWLDHELEVVVNVHEVHLEYEKQSQVRVALAEELAILNQAEELDAEGCTPPRGRNGRISALPPTARLARISSLENMLSLSSNALIAMASQLSEAEERERAFTRCGRLTQLRSMAEAKSLLQYMFNVAAEARCQLWEKNIDTKEMKEQMNELINLLRQSEARRKESETKQKLQEQAVAIALATYEMGNSHGSLKHGVDDKSGALSPLPLPAQKQLKYSAGVTCGANTIGEEVGHDWACWKALEMEEKSPSVAVTI
ncbi:Kinesin-like protein FLA10 [Acorus gramineus]|uniref:Kinesin-like protein n=1 Tax=Acorus gramineus TaxID=55184 RepID=A0AAV9B0F8_ACOGR|nr:Kinesin-like protein FLA10 [Acorus gramineus]